MDTLTPMLAQYQEIKASYQDCILFFRLGDFYEMFAEDAQQACGILDVVLTSRDAGKSGRIPMCGIPYHAADAYIAKLIKAGRKVAICEQVEDPALAKGIVRRQVIRVITSGTYIDESTFETRYLLALSFNEKRFGLAFTDTASGTISTNEYPSLARLAEVVAKLPVYECVFPAAAQETVQQLFASPLFSARQRALSPFSDWSFNTDLCRKALVDHFHVHSLRGFGIEEMPASVSACGALLEYLKQMHRQPLRHLYRISLYADEEYVFISPAACAALDLDGLMQTIDHTRTACGRRTLKNWIYQPLKSIPAICRRQQALQLLRDKPQCRLELEKVLHTIPDIEKSVARISCGNAQAKDLAGLRLALCTQPQLAAILNPLAAHNPLLVLEDIPQLRQLLEEAINPVIPLNHPEGMIINAGYHPELDELRALKEHGREWLKNLQEQEIKRTGISSLKIGFNQVFGYYIEVSNANKLRVPPDYIRRQTLANAERYITTGLKEYEEKILTAEEKILRIERQLIEQLQQSILDYAGRLHAFSSQLATIDALYSLSITSTHTGYTAPQLSDDTRLLIKDGRHPMVEEYLSTAFVPNDTLLDTQENHLMILTGPNMSGKSTFIRQNALLVIMAQMGSFIPAHCASIGIVDKIFTRIGAHDEITKGQSTFMVEMSEAAGILNNLTPRSLIVLDEIGRGTSTFDGLSLAWAIAEHLAQKKVRTLFATHFHELTALSEEFPGAKNFNVAVREWNEQVLFLHKIIPGGTDDSYGIYVAKLAGIPREVIHRSEQILCRLELSSNLQEKIRNRLAPEDQLQLFAVDTAEILRRIENELRELDTNTLTPLQALAKLQELKEWIAREDTHG